MRFIFVLICITGVALASDADICPNPGVPGIADADLTQLDNFDIDALGASGRSVGVGYDGTNFWVTDAQSSGGNLWIHIISNTIPHVLVTTVDQNSLTSGWGLRDLCWDGTYMYASAGTTVDYYDASYVKAGSYTHSAVTPNRVQGWDGTYFYTGSFGSDIYQVTWDGVSGSSASSVVWTSPVPNGAAYGAAWDDWNNCLWISTAAGSGDGMLYQYDPVGTLLFTYSLLPESPTSGGCTMADFGSSPAPQLWVLSQGSPDMVYCWETVVALERDTWGSIKTVF